MENNYNYKFNVYPLSEEDGGGFYAEVPELPGCIASAETLEETMDLLKEAIESWVEVSKGKGKKIPNVTYYDVNDSLPSGRFGVRISRTTHKKLLQIAKEENISLNALVAKYLEQMLTVKTIDAIIAEKLGNEESSEVEILPKKKTWEYDSKDKCPIYLLRGDKSA